MQGGGRARAAFSTAGVPEGGFLFSGVVRNPWFVGFVLLAGPLAAYAAAGTLED